MRSAVILTLLVFWGCSDSGIIFLDDTPPEQPSNLTAVADVSSVLLAWTKSHSNDVGGYVVYYARLDLIAGFSDDKTYYSDIDVGDVAVFTVSGLTSGKPYVFHVTAYGYRVKRK